MRSTFFIIFASLLFGFAAYELTGIARGGLMVGVQAALHAGVFVGLAAASLSFLSAHISVRLMMLGGVLCLVCLIGEDVRGLIVDNPRWQKDLTDFIPRLAALIVLAQRLRSAQVGYSSSVI